MRNASKAKRRMPQSRLSTVKEVGSQRNRLILFGAAAGVLGMNCASHATTVTHVITGGASSWNLNTSVGTNWTPAGVPNAAGDIAELTANTATSTNFDTGGALTIGQLLDTGTNAWTLTRTTTTGLTLSGTGTTVNNPFGNINAAIATTGTGAITVAGFTNANAITLGTSTDIGAMSTGTVTVSGAIVGGGSPTTLTFRANAGTSGTALVTDSGSIATSGGGQAIQIVNSGTGSGAVLLSGAIGGLVSGGANGGVTQSSNTSMLVLTGANTFSSGVGISGTAAVVAQSNAAATANATVISLGTGIIKATNANSLLQIRANSTGTSGGTVTTGNGTTGNSVNLANGGGGNFVIDVNNDTSGSFGAIATGTATNVSFIFNALTVGNNKLTAQGMATGTVKFTGATTLTGAVGTFNASGTGIYLTGVGESGGTGRVLSKAGSGTLTLAGTSSYTGATSITAGKLAAGSATGFSSASQVVLSNVSGVVLDTTGFNTAIGSLTGGGGSGGNVTLGSATLTVGADGTSPVAFAGIMSGTGGSLIKTGSGTEIFTGTNSYTGTTAINNGSLLLGSGGSLNSSSAVTVGNTLTASLTPTLGGVGTANGSVTVHGPGASGSAGHIAPGITGTNPGTLNVGSINLNSGSILDFDLAGTSSSDKIAAAGSFTLGASSITLNITDAGSLANGTFVIGSYGTLSGVVGSNSNITNFAIGITPLANKTYTFSDTGATSGSLELTIADATTVATTYSLTAVASGGSLADGRLTQGQSTNLTGTITNTGTGAADSLDYSGLSVAGQNSGAGTNLAQGASGAPVTGTFTASTLGTNTLTTTVTSATNSTVGGNASLSASVPATVFVDALVEHTTTFNDTGSAATSSTSAYRQNYIANGNLGTVTLTKAASGEYSPGYADNINGGAGVAAGTLTVAVAPTGSHFDGNDAVFLLDFANVGSGTTSNLSALEAALGNLGISYVDRDGGTNAVLTNDTLLAYQTGSRDYDLELVLNGPSSSPTYFDFNFGDFTGATGNVVNIGVVPEPIGVSLLAAGACGILSRRKRVAGKK